MSKITQTKLEDLNILKLYEHYGALERSLPLLTPESQQLAQAELEACASLRSEKVDRIYYAMAAHEDALERIKKEADLIAQAKRHHESQLSQLKNLVSWLRRALPLDSNRIQGKNYEFVLSKKKELTVEITSDPEFWHTDERTKYCIEQETTTTKRIVVRSMSGEVLSERTEPKTKLETLPNLDAIRDAYQNGDHLPQGVKVEQQYAIRKNRLFSTKRMESQAPEYFGELLQESDSAN
jgi:uncharacterized protein (DUF2235 family)